MVCSNLSTAASADRGALAALAETCTTLHDPALDALWNTQNTIKHVLACMPEDLYNIAPHLATNTRPLRLVRPIITADWDRSLCYASRVKHLHLNSMGRGLSHVLPALNLCLPGGLLFPNLESLNWLNSATEFICIRMFLTPKLSNISLVFDPSSINISLLSTLARTCPGLKNVSLGFGPVTPPGTAGVISMFVQSLQRVEFLEVATLDLAALKHVGQLPQFTGLVMGTLPAELSSTSITRPIFLGLRNLTLSQVDITLMTTLLGMCSQTPLVSLKLDFCPCPTVTAMEVFFTALAASSSHSSLITLSLGIDLASDFFEAFSNPSTFAVNDHSLRILFCFPNLTTFSITSPVGFDVSTNTVVDLACAWPRLENLGLLTLLQLIPVRVTLESLYFIAKHCPHLHSLAMTFDATVIPAAPKSIPQQCMSSLGVALSPISTSGAVARILSDIFPNLQKIHTDFDDDEEDDGTEHRRWKEVESLLPEFVATREEERMRARG